MQDVVIKNNDNNNDNNDDIDSEKDKEQFPEGYVVTDVGEMREHENINENENNDLESGLFVFYEFVLFCSQTYTNMFL